MFENATDILKRISNKNEKLAEICNIILNSLIELESLRMDRENSEMQTLGKRKRQLIDDVSKAVDRLADGLNNNNINMIPGEPSTSCYPICISKAFDKWGAINGFKGVAERTITYWLSCSKVNQGTLILTFAWDEIDFMQKLKEQFDGYANNPDKTVCVILITSQGFSIQYLK